MIRAFLGVAHNDWFRGRLEGIATPDLNRLLPFRRKFAWNVLAHVVLPARLQQSVLTGRRPATGKAAGYRLPRAAFRNLLMGLRRWIALLHPADTGKTVWVAYPEMHGYSTQEESAKRQFVADFVDMTRPDILWDLGCNSGEYSELALSAGAARVIGFDFDQGALERAFARSDAKALAMQPLYLDAANPSPQQGWNADERKGLQSRAKADALLALAFFHHLAVGRNIPMDRAIDWIIGLAPRGVIEFVPKSDPAIVRMLLLRSDIFKDYSEATFLALIKGRARIVRSETVSDTGRRLVWYDRTDHR